MAMDSDADKLLGMPGRVGRVDRTLKVANIPHSRYLDEVPQLISVTMGEISLAGQ